MYNGNCICEYKTKNEDGLIGHSIVTYTDVMKIFKCLLRNSFYNWISKLYGVRNERYVKIWAIDDLENNYNIYIENQDILRDDC